MSGNTWGSDPQSITEFCHDFDISNQVQLIKNGVVRFGIEHNTSSQYKPSDCFYLIKTASLMNNSNRKRWLIHPYEPQNLEMGESSSCSHLVEPIRTERPVLLFNDPFL